MKDRQFNFNSDNIPQYTERINLITISIKL